MDFKKFEKNIVNCIDKSSYIFFDNNRLIDKKLVIKNDKLLVYIKVKINYKKIIELLINPTTSINFGNYFIKGIISIDNNSKKQFLFSSKNLKNNKSITLKIKLLECFITNYKDNDGNKFLINLDLINKEIFLKNIA